MPSRKTPAAPPGSKLLDDEKWIYRIHSGNYRIVYQIRNKVLLVIVAKVHGRKDIYKNQNYLIRRLK